MGDDYDGTRHLFLKDYGAATIILRTFANATYDTYPFDLYQSYGVHGERFKGVSSTANYVIQLDLGK